MESFLLEVMGTFSQNPGIELVVDYWDQLGKPLMLDCSGQDSHARAGERNNKGTDIFKTALLDVLWDAESRVGLMHVHCGLLWDVTPTSVARTSQNYC